MRFHDFREWNRRRRRAGAAFVKRLGAALFCVNPKEHRLVMSGPLERLFIERPYVARENSNRTSQIFLRQIG
jgi:hypothetical protein